MRDTQPAVYRSFLVAVVGVVVLVMATSGCGPGGGNGPEPTPTPKEVVLEIDQMSGTRPLETTQDIAGTTVSLADIYAAGGLALDIRHDESDLPRQESIGLAQLHALMTSRSSVTAGAADKVYVLVVTEEAGKPGTLGIMFDFGELDVNDVPREAFAIFQTAHDRLSTPLAAEMLLTCAHELAHVFNLHHPDWEGQQFDTASTIEGYSLTDTVVWSLSNKSLSHLRDHADRLVHPGAGSLPFGMVTRDHLDDHQSVPRESFDVVDASDLGSISRHSGVAPEAAVRSVLAADSGAGAARTTGTLELAIAATKNRYVIGEPVVLTVRLKNTGDSPTDVLSLLEPEFGFLSISIKHQEGGAAHRFRPAVLYDARGLPETRLEPGGAIVAEARVFFGAGGWTFERPGEYVIRADYPSSPAVGGARVASSPLSIAVEEPQTEVATRAVMAMRAAPDSRRLGTQQGLYLLFGGGDHLIKGSQAMQEIAQTAPTAPHAPAARLALASAAVAPTTDPTRREVPQPRLDEALQYLEGLEPAAVSPLTLRQIQRDLASELEVAGRGDEAAALREQSLEELRRRPMFHNVEPTVLRRMIREDPGRNP